MDLFSITCTTCKSRLRVREESAIGQILACPKCGGMVMIKPPEGWAPGEPAPLPRVDAPAGITAVVEVKRKDDTLSDSAFDAIDDILASAPPKPKQPVVSVAEDAPGLARPRFVAGPAHPPAGGSSVGKATTAIAPANSAAPASPQPPAAKAVTAAPPPAAASEDESVPDFRPPTTRSWRYYALMAASVLAGVGLALAVVVATASFFRGEPEETAKAIPPDPVTSPGRQATQSPPDTPTPKPAEQGPEATPKSDSSGAQPVAPAPAAPPAAQPTPPAPADVPKPASPPAASSPFEALLAPEQDPLAANVVDSARPAPPLAEPPPEETPAKPLVPRPEPREVDVAARLADPLAGLETDGTPLADFLQVMSDLSTIPITLEPDALPLAQASATSPVVLKLANTTIHGALTAGLSRLGLEHVARDGQLVVRLIEPAEMPIIAYPHKDLTGGDETAAAELAELIQAVVDPPSWAVEGAGAAIEVSDTLKIRQRRANHAQIFILCEKLRTSRKLPYASKYPPALFQLDSRTKQAGGRLRAAVSLKFHQPTPLVKILHELEQAAAPPGPAGRTGSLRILVDWRDIAGGGWNPDAQATLAVENESLALALQKLLEPMELAWRVVDAQAIQVISPASLADRCEIELFPVADLVKEDPSGQSLLTEIRQTLGANLFRDSGGPCEIRLDPAGQCLVALLPQPKQQDLEVFLMTLRRPQ